MTATQHPPPVVGSEHGHEPHDAPALRRALIGLHGFVAANALYGGIGLMVNGMGMPRDWLDRTPFDSWVLPGAALLGTVMVPQVAGAVAQVRDGEDADRVTLATGLGLVAWIVVQVAVLRRYFFLQPVIAAFGGAEAGLSWWRLRRRRHDGPRAT